MPSCERETLFRHVQMALLLIVGVYLALLLVAAFVVALTWPLWGWWVV